MENCQMNRPGCRPYNNTCQITKRQAPGQCPAPGRAACQNPASCGDSCQNAGSRRDACQCPASRQDGCSCHMPGIVSPEAELYRHVDQMPDAMAYVPCQEFTTTFELGYALNVGTIFP